MLYLLHDNDEDDDFVEDDFASDSNDMFDSTPEEDNFIIRQREEVTSFEQEDVDDSGRFDILPSAKILSSSMTITKRTI